MKKFQYTITDPVGVHARPAGALVKAAKQYDSKIVVFKGEKSAEARKLMAIMALGITVGMEVTVEVEGSDEEIAAQGMEQFFKENL